MKNTSTVTIRTGGDTRHRVTITRDGDLITAAVGRLTFSVPTSTSVPRLIARRDAARADLSSVEPDDESGPGGSCRSAASFAVEAGITAILAEIGDTTPDRPARPLSEAVDYVHPRITLNGLATPEGRAAAYAIWRRLDSATTLAEILDASDDARALLKSGSWLDAAAVARQEIAAAAARKARDLAIANLPDTGSGYGRHAE